MKYWLLIIISFSIISCKDSQKHYTTSDRLINFLQDSTTLFSNIEQIIINGEIESSKVRLKFYSVSEKEFMLALRDNEKNVRFFTKKNKFNENLLLPEGNRVDSVLRIGNNKEYIYLVDLRDRKNFRARNFFLEDKIGNFFIIKRIQFEDSETIFWNNETKEEELYLSGISVCTNSKDLLVFYSSTFKVTPEDKNPVCLFSLKHNKVDTLLCINTDWFTHFSFFDMKDSSIYYIHSYYDDDILKSTYAKMDILPPLSVK